MKKLIFVMLFSFLTVTFCNAQVALSDTTGAVSDTVTNTGTSVIFTPVRGYQSTVTIQADITKVSGTLAGSLTPVVSNDGITFYPIPIINNGTDSAKTITDVASQGFVFNMPPGYLYYGLKWVGNGTMVGAIKGTCIYRRR